MEACGDRKCSSVWFCFIYDCCRKDQKDPESPAPVYLRIVAGVPSHRPLPPHPSHSLGESPPPHPHHHPHHGGNPSHDHWRTGEQKDSRRRHHNFRCEASYHYHQAVGESQALQGSIVKKERGNNGVFGLTRGGGVLLVPEARTCQHTSDFHEMFGLWRGRTLGSTVLMYAPWRGS